jgi:two-component system NtrC family sensor kinase
MRASFRLNETDLSARSDQELLAGTLALSIARAWRIEGRGAAEYTLQYAQQYHKQTRLRLVRLDGQGLSTERPILKVSDMDLRQEKRADSKMQMNPDSSRVLVTYSSLGLQDDQVPYALEFATPMPNRRSLLIEALQDELLIVGLFAAIAAFMLLVFGGWIIGRPINQLVLHTAKLGEGDLQSRVHINRRDELGDLATSMNRLAERLAEARTKVEAETEARITALEQLRHSERLATVGKLAAALPMKLARR